jgi:hypothetical protein
VYYHATYHSFIQGPYTHNISHVFKVKQTQNFISIGIICTGSFAEKKELESTDVVHQTNDLLLLHKDVALAMHGAPVMNETTRTGRARFKRRGSRGGVGQQRGQKCAGDGAVLPGGGARGLW